MPKMEAVSFAVETTAWSILQYKNKRGNFANFWTVMHKLEAGSYFPSIHFHFFGANALITTLSMEILVLQISLSSGSLHAL